MEYNSTYTSVRNLLEEEDEITTKTRIEVLYFVCSLD